MVHMVGDAMVGMQYFWSSFPFFLAQAVAIIIEDIMIGLARRAGINTPTNMTCAVGYTWVFIWLSVSVPWLLNWQIAAGLGLSDTVPISPAMHAVKLLNETMNIDIIPCFVPSQFDQCLHTSIDMKYLFLPFSIFGRDNVY